MEAVPYTITQDSITVIWKGKPKAVQKGAPNFLSLRRAILEEQWDQIPKFLTVAKSLSEWAQGRFSVKGDRVYLDDRPFPTELNARVFKMAADGEDPRPLFRFWERLSKNPSYRSVEQLYRFLQHCGISIVKDGCFYAYKGVRRDYKDHHSGKFDNRPGAHNKMPRNQVSDDPNVDCHEGFHVGSLQFARSFAGGGPVVVCKVDPEHVVSVPYDASSQKMRTCEYLVVGNYGAQLPDTTFEADETIDPPEPSGEGSSEPAARKPSPHDSLDSSGLMELSIGELRQYAGKNLLIVGASKIPGGKSALITKILEIRHGG